MADCKPLPPLSDSDIRRFLKKIDKTPGQGPKGDCWGWTDALGSQGYGKFGVLKRSLNANRVALFLHSGADPFPLQACHACDWKPCCRGEHLFAGTQADNNADKARKGRAPSGKYHSAYLHPERMAHGDKNGSRLYPERLKRGEENPQAKITAAQVQEIRSLYATGHIFQKDLAARFGIALVTISDITRRKSWRHLP